LGYIRKEGVGKSLTRDRRVGVWEEGTVCEGRGGKYGVGWSEKSRPAKVHPNSERSAGNRASPEQEASALASVLICQPRFIENVSSDRKESLERKKQVKRLGSIYGNKIRTTLRTTVVFLMAELISHGSALD
jgi:hypothetical protein